MAVLPKSPLNNKRPFRLVRGVSSVGDLVDGASWPYNYPGEGYPNKVYFVNNITGSSTNDGASWDTPMDQVSTAVTAWATYLATLATNNQNIRGKIYVQGTGTAYTAITAYPQYCDLIGVGADCFGNGAGIARITGSTSAAASGAARGLNIYNMQFIGSGSYYAATFSVLFRSVIEHCAFVNGATGGLDVTSMGGSTIRDCQIGCGDTTFSVTGLRIASAGANFNNCLVEHNSIYGSTTGFANAGYLCNGTRVQHNMIAGGTTGIADTSSHTTLGVLPWYIGNYVYGGTDAISCSNGGGANVLGNFVCDATEHRIESTPLVSTST